MLGSVSKAARWSAGPTTARSTTCRWLTARAPGHPLGRCGRDGGDRESSTSRPAAAPRTTSWARSHGLTVIAPLDGYGDLRRRLRLAHRDGRPRRGEADPGEPEGEGDLLPAGDLPAPLSRSAGAARRSSSSASRTSGSSACDEIRPLMKAAAERVRWIPESVGKRTQDWYNNMGDWCISRKRYWGLPLPVLLLSERGT